MTPEQLRESAKRIRLHNKGIADWWEAAEIIDAHAAALEEIERLKKENDTLRGLLGNSAKPCPYCGLPAEDQAKCPSGFPGCARADDQMLSKHFADAYRAEQAERRAERLQAQVDALMLEYCPDEMTPEQLAEWEKHQRAVPAEFNGE